MWSQSTVVGIRVDENIQTGKSQHCNSSYVTMVAAMLLERRLRYQGL
jgi:hypothetical protein